MRLVQIILLLSVTCLTASAQRFVKVFDSVAALLAANPNDVHTNAFVTGGTTANDGRGGIYTWNSTSTTATNAVIHKANNFSTGRWFRENGFVLTTLTASRAAVIGADSVLTNSAITIVELNTLTGIGGNIQQQINNLIALDTNWENDGATNADLVGVADVWKLRATNSAEIGQAGEAGYIDMSSTNGTYTTRITITNNGGMVLTNSGPTNDFDVAAFNFITASNDVSDIAYFWNPNHSTANPAALIGPSGAFIGGSIYVESFWGSDEFTRIQPGVDITQATDANNRFVSDLTADPTITRTHDGTNIFALALDSGYTGSGTKALTDDGTYQTFGASSLTINPTDNYIPYRSSSTTFGNSPFQVINGNTNFIGFNDTNKFLTVRPDLAGHMAGSVGIGFNALGSVNNNVFDGNVAVGTSALATLSSGFSNVGLGTEAGFNLTTAFGDLLFGNRAGYNLTTQNGVVAIGHNSFGNLRSADATAVGYQSGIIASNAARSIFIGSQPLNNGERSDKIMSDTIHIGHKASTLTNNTQTITNAIYIGSGLLPGTSNEIVVGNTNQTKAFFATTTYSGVGTNFLSDDGTYKNIVILAGNDPDITAENQISYDSNGDVLRGFDGSNQVALGRKIEAIHFVVVSPNDLADSERDAFWIWENVSGMSFVVTGWSFKSDTDDTTLNIEEIDNDGANNTTVDAVEIATNGTGLFYASDTTITAPTIENGHLLVIDFDDTDTPGQVKGTVFGYYDANVN